MMDTAIRFEMILNAKQDQIWKMWTTREGLKSFFAQEAKIDLMVGGSYELYFDLEAPEGERGAEGMQILAIEENRMLSFTWNAPPRYPLIRGQRTFVCVRFEEIPNGKSKLILENFGYGYSREWQESLEYFKIAWGNVVLPRLKYCVEEGPFDWADRISLEKYYLYNETPEN